MDSTLIGALIGAIVALITMLTSAIVTIKGWRANQRQQLQQQKYAAEIAHVSLQITELYGPLYGLILQLDGIKNIYACILPSNHAEKDDSDKEDFTKIWLFFREKYIYPIGKKQAELITSKQHLLTSKEMPECFYQFLQHQATRECLLNLWKIHGISTIGRKGLSNGYPEDKFKEHVKSNLENLKNKYHELMRKTTTR